MLSDDQIYQTTVLKNFSNMQTRRQILFSDSSIADSKTETHPMKKYDFFSRNLRSQRQALQADSDQDEMDNGNGRSIAATERYEQWRVVTWSKTVVFTILTVLTTIFNVVTFNSFRAKERPYAYNYRHYQSKFIYYLNKLFSELNVFCSLFNRWVQVEPIHEEERLVHAVLLLPAGQDSAAGHVVVESLVHTEATLAQTSWITLAHPTASVAIWWWVLYWYNLIDFLLLMHISPSDTDSFEFQLLVKWKFAQQTLLLLISQNSFLFIFYKCGLLLSCCALSFRRLSIVLLQGHTSR